MHQTTIRFGHDLWAALEAESAQQGMSAAQFIREATVGRLVYAAARRGDPQLEAALQATGADESASMDPQAVAEAVMRAAVDNDLDTSEERVGESAAMWAQTKLARQRAQQLRERAERHRLRLIGGQDTGSRA